MDKYIVKLYTRACRDLDDIYTYIARNLLEPDTALNIVDELEEAIYKNVAQFTKLVLMQAEITINYLSKIIVLFTV